MCMGLSLGFLSCSSDLYFRFMPVPQCLDYCSFVVQSEIMEPDSSSSIFLSQDCFGYSGSFVFPYKLWYFLFQFCEKCQWQFDRDCIESVDCFGQSFLFYNKLSLFAAGQLSHSASFLQKVGDPKAFFQFVLLLSFSSRWYCFCQYNSLENFVGLYESYQSFLHQAKTTKGL